LGTGVSVGAQTHLRPHVTLYPGTVVGSDCLLHAGVVLGADGFGFAPTGGRWEKIAQLGRVVIGDRVEIGANSTIDRGALEDTVIGDDVIIDNLVQIGHNAELGAGSAMAGQSGLAGSAKVGKRVLVGGQAGIAGHITIADGVHFHGQAMVNKSIAEAGSYASGVPVQPASEWRKLVARLKQLTELNTRVTTLWQAHTDAKKTKD
ncbi:MAG: UDP-3-O-(3-hydroxymyristoyl)glucosamine N-acyltransferase, partial [Natronospirillum sp.]